MYQHITLEIVQDEYPRNPRDESDNLSTFYGPRGTRYIVGGKDDIELSRESLEETIKAFRKEGAIVEEFESNAGACYAVVFREQLKKEYLDHGYSMRKALYHARQCAKGEIKTWLAWCEGEVYGYIIRGTDGEDLESCWGFYGREYAEGEGQGAAEYHERKIESLIQAEERAIKARLNYVKNYNESV